MSDTQTGRPTVIGDEVVRKLEEALKQGFSVLKACELSGISRSTYYEHVANNSDFSDKMTLAQQWVTEQAKLVVAKAIDKGDLASAKWWLERKARDEFGSKEPIPAEGTDARKEILRKYGLYEERSDDSFKVLREIADTAKEFYKNQPPNNPVEVNNG